MITQTAQNTPTIISSIRQFKKSEDVQSHCEWWEEVKLRDLKVWILCIYGQIFHAWSHQIMYLYLNKMLMPIKEMECFARSNCIWWKVNPFWRQNNQFDGKFHKHKYKNRWMNYTRFGISSEWFQKYSHYYGIVVEKKDIVTKIIIYQMLNKCFILQLPFVFRLNRKPKWNILRRRHKSYDR